MANVLATIRIVPEPGQEDHVLRALRSHADSVTALPGCAAAEILREVYPPGAVVYAETWLDEEHLARHLGSANYEMVLGLLESSAAPPRVEFQIVSETRGLAWVEQLRLGGSGTTTSVAGDAAATPPGNATGTLRLVPRKPTPGARR